MFEDNATINLVYFKMVCSEDNFMLMLYAKYTVCQLNYIKLAIWICLL